MEAVLFFIRKLSAFAGWKLYSNLTGMVVASFLESIGLLLLVPMLSLSGISGMRADATPMGGWLGFLSNMPQNTVLPAVLGLFALIVIFQALLKRHVTVRNIKLNQAFDLSLKTETYRLLLGANWSFFAKRRKSDMLNALTGEISRISGGVGMSLQLLATVIFTVIQIGLAFWLSPPVTAFVIVCGAGLAFASRKFVRRAKTIGAQSTELSKQYLAGLSDQINGIKDIKTNALERSRLHWMRTTSAKVKQEHIDLTVLKTTTQLYYQIASALLIAGFIYLSVEVFHTRWEQLLLIVVIFSRLWPRFAGFQSNIEQIAAFMPAYRNVSELQDECRAAAELVIQDREERSETPSVPVARSLACHGVFFRYDREDPKYALQQIDLTIPAGSMTAVVGRSGAGKSTLIDLLMGLIVPEKGEVIVDGVPLTGDRLMGLRRSISYVAQDPFLFNDTIRENLRMVKPDATEADMWEALDFAASSAFVRKLPAGLDTFIGDRGVRLSGGERQRLVLARAILRKPSVLVLDEATSALDTENEGKIQEAIERLRGTITLIVIAHRLSTIRGADQVVVLDQGRIVQTGKFGELAGEKRSLFSHLLENQALAAGGNG